MLSFKQINARSENFREVPKLPLGVGRGQTIHFFISMGLDLVHLNLPCCWKVSLINISELVWSLPSSCWGNVFYSFPQAVLGFGSILSRTHFPSFFFWWAPGVAVCLNTCLVTTEWPGLNKNQDCSRLSPRRQCNLSNSKMPIGVKDLGKAEDWVSNKRLRCQMSLWSKLLRSINCKTRPAPSCTLSRTAQAPLHHSIKEEAVASHSEKGRHNVTQLEEGMCRFRAKLIAPWSQIMTPKTKYSWLCPERPT